MKSLKSRIEEYVCYSLHDYRPPVITAPKVIHEAITGSNMFQPHEMAIMDLPIVQRLRSINQVGLANLVFPSSNHCRFDHTIGVSVLVDKMVSALWRKIEDKEGGGRDIKLCRDTIYNNARVAAILHDIGHGPFSHISEKIYKNNSDIKNEISTDVKLAGAQAHEVLAYLIIRSDCFREYFEKNIHGKYPDSKKVDLDLVSEIIVGYSKSDSQKSLIVDIVNGAFDADKLDYIQRDSHFTGIKMVLDMERLFHTVGIVKDDNGFFRLGVELSGVSTLEQIVFNKMMLFSTIYHHQKVITAEVLFRDIFYQLKDNGLNFNNLNFESTSDYLYLTDHDVFSLEKENIKYVSGIARDLTMRKLPKRALVISMLAIEEGIGNLGELMTRCKEPREVDDLRKAIAEEANKCKNNLVGTNISPCDILIDMPEEPKFKEAMLCPIINHAYAKGYTELREIFPVDDWVRAFTQNKWKGYIFTKLDYIEPVHHAAQKVIHEIFGIKLKKDLARMMCKLPM